LSSISFSTLDSIWREHGAICTEIPSGSFLWHCGNINKFDEISNDRMLWTTRNEKKKSFYLSYGRDSNGNSISLSLLEFKTTKTLKLANFNKVSILSALGNFFPPFDHPAISSALRDWCVANTFDGAVSINSEVDEVVICNPRDSLVINQITS